MASMMETIGAAMKGKLTDKDKKKLEDAKAEKMRKSGKGPGDLAPDVKSAVSPFSYLFTSKKTPKK